MIDKGGMEEIIGMTERFLLLLLLKGWEFMKRIIACILAILLILSPSGCGKQTPQDITMKEETVNTTAAVKEPPVEISIFTWDNWYAPASYANGLDVHKFIEEKLNIKFKWNVLPNSEFFTVLNTRLAAGQELEDIIGAAPNPVELAGKSLIIPLNDYISKEKTPNIIKLFNEMPELKTFMTESDGKMYTFPGVVKGYYSLTSTWIRKDWLDKLNLKVPETTDEYLDALIAFRENDANGNNKKDEVFACSSDYYRFLGDSFNCNPITDWCCINNQGKAEMDFLEPRGKAFLEYMNRMWKSGVLDREIVNMPYDVLMGRLANNVLSGINWYPSIKTSFDKQVVKMDPNVNYINVLLKGPYGMQTHKQNPNFYAAHAVTKFAKRVDKIMELMDYWWASDEGYLLTNYGIEGKSYEMRNGEPFYTDWVLKNPDGLAVGDALCSIGCSTNLANIQDSSDTSPKRMNEKDTAEFVKVTSVSSMVQGWYYVKETKEESDLKSTYSNDLNTYLNEMLTKFVTGEEPLSNYDQFSQKLRELGIEKTLKIIERRNADAKK